ncbi:MAG: 23S rRNA pseudouridine(2604) synthase RluF [Clostridiales bacterium]|nr:23S rRNA pseudouridine(2604) synthase RluF [Clostridiales bacterium]
MVKRNKRSILEGTNQSDLENGIRLNKYLSDSGVCSRRQADHLIEQGKVKIDGKVAVTGTRVQKGQKVTVDGKPIQQEEKLVLIAFHKPRGIVCTAEKREKNNIIDYIHYPTRIYPVGRLDKESEGIILLTNHGELANRICKARYYHEKEYIVTVNKPITDSFLKRMSEGVPILGTITRPCKVKKEGTYTFRIILTQGLNRQIRRMCEYLGYQVTILKRIRVMNVELGDLKVGTYRDVMGKELNELNKMLSKERENGTKVSTNQRTNKNSKRRK